jgi:hypothetical protein
VTMDNDGSLGSCSQSIIGSYVIIQGGPPPFLGSCWPLSYRSSSHTSTNCSTCVTTDGL